MEPEPPLAPVVDPPPPWIEINGRYKPCLGCKAAVIIPAPPSQRFTIGTDGLGIWITPHARDCRSPLT